MRTSFGSGFEGLEERTLLAANVTAVLTANGTLTITGDATDQVIYLYGNGNGGEVTLEASGQTLRVNGIDNAASDDDHFFTGAKNIVVNTNGGTDQVVASDISITGNLTSNLGAGNHELLVLVAYGDDLNIGGNVTLNGGAGEYDVIEIHSFNEDGYGITIGGKVDLTVGNYGQADIVTHWYGGDVVIGKDVRINVNSTAGGDGSGFIRTLGTGDGDVTIIGAVTMNGGAGDDHLEIEAKSDGGIEIGGKVLVNGNGGDDELGIAAYGDVYEQDSSYYGYGSDWSGLTNKVATGAVTLNGGDGNDEMYLTAWSEAYGVAQAYYGSDASGTADTQVSVTTGVVAMNGGDGDDRMHIAANSRAIAGADTRGVHSTAYGSAESSASITTAAVNLNGNNGDDTMSVFASTYESADASFNFYDYGYGNAYSMSVPYAESNYFGAHANAYGNAEVKTGTLTMNGGAGPDSGDDELSVYSFGVRSEVTVSGAANLLGGLGNDELTMESSRGPFYKPWSDSVNVIDISGQLKLDGGGGDDDMNLIASRSTFKNDDIQGEQLRNFFADESTLTAGSLTVLGATGNDWFEAYGISIDFNASVNMGAHDDTVRFGFNSIGGSLLLNGGPGNNGLFAYNNDVGIATTQLNFVNL